jgi:DNA-binding NarL/FixJ family response regulator
VRQNLRREGAPISEMAPISVATVGLLVRILLVEDSEPFLGFVSSTLALQPELQVVGEAQNGLEAVEKAEALQPDVILLDIGLPGLNGIDTAHQIRKLVPDARIIFLTQESYPDVVAEAFRLGAWGYIIKVHVSKDLPRALNAVIEGKKFVGSGIDAPDITDPG